MRRENRVLRQEREILKKRRGLLHQGERDAVTAFRFVEAEKATYPVSMLCRLLGVSASGLSCLAAPTGVAAAAIR